MGSIDGMFKREKFERRKEDRGGNANVLVVARQVAAKCALGNRSAAACKKNRGYAKKKDHGQYREKKC